MAIAPRKYAFLLLTLIVLAWGIALVVPRPLPPEPKTTLAPPSTHSGALLLPSDAPIAEIIASVQVQTGLLLTREDARAYQSLVKRGLLPEQALSLVLLYRQALLEAL